MNIKDIYIEEVRKIFACLDKLENINDPGNDNRINELKDYTEVINKIPDIISNLNLTSNNDIEVVSE